MNEKKVMYELKVRSEESEGSKNSFKMFGCEGTGRGWTKSGEFNVRSFYWIGSLCLNNLLFIHLCTTKRLHE